MRRIGYFLLKPFKEDLAYLLVLVLLASSASVYYWVCEGNFVEAIDMAFRGLVVCYMVCLFCNVFSGKLNSLLKILFVVLGTINLIVDKGQYNICHEAFNWDSACIVVGTNMSEASEFVNMYLTPKVIAFIIAVCFVALIIWMFRKKVVGIPVSFSVVLFALMIVGYIFTVSNKLPVFQMDSRWDSVFVCKARLFMTMEKPVDLSLYRKEPSIVKTGDQPHNVVVIIGESVSRFHCSINGYEKNTTPYMEKLIESDSLISFSDVESASFHTIGSFKLMLSTNKAEYDQNTWYDYLTIFDVLKQSGYRSEWISNQSPTGFADNIASGFAELADTSVFVGDIVLGNRKHDYDELLIPALDEELHKNAISSDRRNVCYFIHMIGCHESFRSRYPESFNYFQPDDYSTYPENQRSYLSQYDNAVRYGDYVVSELIDLVKDEECVVIFVPDHALDIYHSRPDYIGHATDAIPESLAYGRSIPFVVYGSPKYRTKFHEDFAELDSIKNDKFNTEDLFQLLLNICNIELTE